MDTISLNLGPCWEMLIRSEMETGRRANAREVLCVAPREHEDKRRKRDALRTHLMEGIEQADQGDFVDDFDIETIVSNADKRMSTQT